MHAYGSVSTLLLRSRVCTQVRRPSKIQEGTGVGAFLSAFLVHWCLPWTLFYLKLVSQEKAEGDAELKAGSQRNRILSGFR